MVVNKITRLVWWKVGKYIQKGNKDIRMAARDVVPVSLLSTLRIPAQHSASQPVFTCLKLTIKTPEQSEIYSKLTIKTPERRH